jgi:hypothetical protein
MSTVYVQLKEYSVSETVSSEILNHLQIYRSKGKVNFRLPIRSSSESINLNYLSSEIRRVLNNIDLYNKDFRFDGTYLTYMGTPSTVFLYFTNLNKTGECDKIEQEET